VTLSKEKPGDVALLVKKYWQLDAELGAKVVEDEVLFQRGWIWPTEGDAAAITEISQFMVQSRLIPKPLTWEQVENSFKKAVPLLQAAYDATGRVPPESAFTDKSAKDLRGPPAWQMDQWKAPT
jgi:hypothetical protein